MNDGTGVVYWITGLSGAGKTTIGKLLYEFLKKETPNIVFLDGDILREVYGNDLGYSLEDRFKGAMRNVRLCKMISDQGIHVVCCTISMFDEVRQWSRDNISNYKEIYLDVPLKILKKRDQKGLYTNVQVGHTKNIVGMDLHLEFPKDPDIKIVNDGKLTPIEILKELTELFGMESKHG